MSDTFTREHMDAAVKLLEENNVPPLPDGYYVAAVHPKHMKRALRRSIARDGRVCFTSCTTLLGYYVGPAR